MNLDTESTTQPGMEGQSKSSSKFLLLQVWCGILTVAMVAMSVLMATIKVKSPEDGGPALKQDNIKPTVSAVASQQSIRSSLSYIELRESTDPRSWEVEGPHCDSCSLVLFNNTIYCKKSNIYFIYAHVTFSKISKKSQRVKSVILIKNPRNGKNQKILVEGTYPSTTEGSVWVAKTVSLKEGDSVSLEISEDFIAGATFWGAFQLY